MNARNLTSMALIALLGGSAAVAQDGSPETPERICPPPLSTCASPDAATDRECPEGAHCVCVPSCPECDDCAARVCVPSPPQPCDGPCDCPSGLSCREGRCIATDERVFCCDDPNCPPGQRCRNRDGEAEVCGEPECRTACDCAPGFGCFDGRCLAGFAAVFCCEGETCPAGQQCQHRDGGMDRCGRACGDHIWLCGADDDGTARSCGPGRICSCTASCPLCEDCGPGVCVPPGAPTPYRCNDDGTCARDADRCVCVSSCPECDDCVTNVCVPDCDAMCEKRLAMSKRRIARVVEKTRPCRADGECTHVATATGCQGTCGAWVNERHAERVAHFIAHVNRRYCNGYVEDGCPFTTPRCVAERGACIRGKCTGVPLGVE